MFEELLTVVPALLVLIVLLTAKVDEVLEFPRDDTFEPSALSFPLEFEATGVVATKTSAGVDVVTDAFTSEEFK